MEDEDRPPICPRCGVTMVPSALSADDNDEGDWVCLECEELEEWRVTASGQRRSGVFGASE